ncbi:MAG: CoA ester lyase [Burkholderiales bacterium]|nr:CoA ester lyase [Burkholderiales bacterium]
MSFTITEQATSRLHRSELAVPGATPALFEKAARSAADVVFLDLEDAVAPDDKDKARRNVIAALNDLDWGAKTLSVRINGLDTPYMYRDIIEIVENCPRLDMLLVPKIGVAADVYAVDMLVTQIETARSRTKRIGLELQIETALGMANVEAIAQASRRAEAICFGAGDFAASTRARTTVIGGINPEYGILAGPDQAGARSFHPADQWHYALARVVIACRAYGLRPVDGPYSDFKDPAGFLAAARRSAVLGFEGKMVIHPSQIAPANEVFSPSAGEVETARRIVAAMEQAAREGRGAVQLDGRLIDIANIRMAQNLISKAEAIAAAGSARSA